MNVRLLLVAACAAALSACGADKPAEAPAAEVAQSAVPVQAPAEPPPAPAQDTASEPPRTPARASAPAPTRADSVAARAEDVTPEWKQRERSMAGTEQCLRQAAGLPEAARAQVEAACRARGQ